jgi:hypothetical protein
MLCLACRLTEPPLATLTVLLDGVTKVGLLNGAVGTTVMLIDDGDIAVPEVVTGT